MASAARRTSAPKGVDPEQGYAPFDLARSIAEDSLAEYIRQTWPVIEPDTPYLHNWHIDAIAEHLEAVTAGQIKRLLVNQPPRSMKSIAISVCWPTWEWGPHNMAGKRWLFGSYSSSLSLKHANDRRTIMQAPWYQRRWGGRFRLTKDAEHEVINSKRGHFIASSVGGPPHGKGGNRIVIDDLLDPEQALSDTERATANRVFDSTYYQRLDNKKDDVIVIVMQRLHEDHLAGHVLADLGWQRLILPAEAEGKTYVVFPLSRTVVCREEGQDTLILRRKKPVGKLPPAPGRLERRADAGILWPEREGRKELDSARFRLGSYGFSGQYQQRPSPLGGGMIKRAWFRSYKVLPKIRRLILSWDTAFKEKQENDYSVCQVWAETELGFFLIDQWREKVEMPELKRAATWLMTRWLPSVALIEDKASGQSLIQELRRPPIQGANDGALVVPSFPILPVKADSDKVVRAAAVTPIIEGGLVWLPADAPWLEDFFYEATRFPKAPHDDQVDAMVHALTYLRGSGSMLEYYRQQLEAQQREVDLARSGITPPAAPANPLVAAYQRKLDEIQTENVGGSAASEMARRLPFGR